MKRTEVQKPAPIGPSPVSPIAQLSKDLITLTQQQVQLARTEFVEKVSTFVKSSTSLIIGGALGFAALIAILVSSAIALSHMTGPAVAAAIVGMIVIVMSLLLIQKGRNSLTQLSIIPKQAVASAQADVALVRDKLVNPVSRDANDQSDGTKRKEKAGKKNEHPSLWGLLKATVQEWLDDEASLLAASLSYYSAISLAPLLVLIVVVAGLFLSQDIARDQLLEQLRSAVGAEGAQFLELVLENAEQPGVATLAGIVSFLTLIWGSTNVFSQLQGSLNKIWEVEPKPGRGLWGTIRERLLSLGMVLGIAFLLLISFVLSAALSTLNNYGQTLLPGMDILWQMVNFVISFGVVTLLFATIYKVLPDAQVEWHDVWIGAAATALLFTIGKTLLGIYLSNAGSSYGAAGSLIAFLLWVYYSAQILFFGAEFTQLYARYYGSGIQPAEDAQRTDTASA